MSSVFKSPKMPQAPEPVKTPTIDEASITLEQSDKMQKRKGKASTILTGQQSRTQMAGSLKNVLGQ
jgi:hypothetical protein